MNDTENSPAGPLRGDKANVPDEFRQDPVRPRRAGG